MPRFPSASSSCLIMLRWLSIFVSFGVLGLAGSASKELLWIFW